MCKEKESSLDMEQFNAYYGLEEHLKAFRNVPLYEKLCCSWEVDKQKYITHISTSAQRFPHYSDHGESHSKKIISSIEFILGKKRIKQLSVSDTWLLLQCAYTHDIGMSISANELFKKMAEDKDFYNKVKEICSRDDGAREAFEFIQPLFDYYLFKTKDNENDNLDDEYFVKTNLSQRIDAREQYDIFMSTDLTRWPLKLINAFSVILENYARPRHGEFSEEMLTKDFAEVCENGIIPIRLRYLVARIASFHMKDREILFDEFPQESLGICNDYIHPRFAAIMLRLGDLLDLDNGRFNQAQLNVFGQEPYVTMIHQFKHEAVTHFLITPLEICVKANFTSQTAEKLLILRNNREEKNKDTEKNAITETDKIKLCMKACKALYEWLRMLQDELIFLSINWLKIIPRKFDGSCPHFEKPVLSINGRNIQEHELNLSYKITTKRSAEIIEGAGLYSEPQFTFLREILQNALDATKLQIYRDVMSGVYPEFYDENRKLDASRIKKLTPLCFCEKLKENLNLYRIEYDIHPKIENKSVYISIRDYGTGITYDDLTGMLKIGQSNKVESNQDINDMPVWLKPTGSFGIGLQSIFYVAKSFKILSRPRFEKEHSSPPLREMIFFSTRMGGEIDITLRPENEAKIFGYGTEVIIEIDFHEDKDKLLLYMNKTDRYKDTNYFDVFSDDINRICKLYIDRIHYIYSNFIFVCAESKQGNNLPILRCSKSNAKKENCISTVEVAFGNFCILSDHGIIKKCSDKNIGYFSCWNEKYKILIKYMPCTTAYGYNSKVTLFYKGIRIDSEKAKNKIHIPFWDTEIYLFSEYANAILEVSRDEILAEKINEIIIKIYRVHYCFLKFIFNSENAKVYSREIKSIWMYENKMNNNLNGREKTNLYSAKSYLAALMYFVSNHESSDIEFRNELMYSSEKNNNMLMDCEKIAYYIMQGCFLRRRFVEKLSELSVFSLIVKKYSSNIWFAANKRLPYGDVSLQYLPKTKDSLVIVEDYFYHYPQFAACAFKILIITGWQEPIIIYKAPPHKNGEVFL